MNKIKILELCHFSAGICGVWSRVNEESQRLDNLGYEVRIFSSNATKGSNDKAKKDESIGNVRVNRFPYVKLGGESFMFWNFFNEAVKFAPDVIIAHVYRHMHTTTALKVKRELSKLGKKCLVVLVTHAPFNQDNSQRGLIANLAVKLYDQIIGRKTINNFDRIITISNWEVPYLSEIGVLQNKIFYLPNGVPEEFFNYKPKEGDKNKILFLGRMAPVKNLELVIRSINKINKKYFIEIVGPVEDNYRNILEDLSKKENVNKRVIFSKPIYRINEKIKKIDSARFFILPSKREGMPQSLIESMARGRVCIGSNAEGISDLIKNKSNGLTFKSNDLNSLIKTLNYAINLPDKKIKAISKKSINFTSKFNWSKIIDKLDKLIKSELYNIQ